MKRLFRAPTTVNLELTELCNVKCRHCYNFWRDESMGSASLSTERLDALIDRLVEAQVFHVVLSGGEPMARLDLLCHALERLRDANISVSVNSNLMLASDETMRRLAGLGVDHILTSLPSIDAPTNDFIMNSKGSLARIVAGIQCAVRHGVRVSVNMVITRHNHHQVYEAGRFIAGLGAQKLFVTRSVPPVYSDTGREDTYSMTPEQVRGALDQAIAAKRDFGILIGTLVSYPLCFLGDLERYIDFVGRGCPAQGGHRMSINADGTVHACVHEEEGYGNVFETPVEAIYQGRMRKWHDSSFHYEGCAGCRYADVCESGCSMNAIAHYGSHAAKDPLFVGHHAFTRHLDLTPPAELMAAITGGLAFIAPPRLRFRAEDGFHLLNVRWGNSITVSDSTARFLMARQADGQRFTLADFGADKADELAQLYLKDAVEAPDLVVNDDRARFGLSLNPSLLAAE